MQKLNHDTDRSIHERWLSPLALQLLEAENLEAAVKKLVEDNPEANYKLHVQEVFVARGMEVLDANEKADELLRSVSTPPPPEDDPAPPRAEAANDNSAGLALVDGLDAAAKEPAKKKSRKPKAATLATLEKLLTDPTHVYDELFRLNEMTGEIELTKRPPWHSIGKTLEEADVSEFRARIEKQQQLIASSNLAWEAIAMVAARVAYNPLREYVQGLEWDGVERIDTWLIEHAGAEDTPLVRAMSAKFLIAMVSRAITPGEQADDMLMLQGDQGVGKSTMLRALAGEKWFSDADIDFHSKDTFELLRYCWLVEMGELAALNRRDTETAKGFISRREDMFRLAYGRKNQKFPRHCVFAGTTNHDEFLRDQTGNRRYWVVKVKQCDPSGVANVRDQLFAEARVRYEQGEAWHLPPELTRELARAQESVMREPMYAPLIAAEIERIGLFRTMQPVHALMDSLKIPHTAQNVQLFTQALQHLGYEKKHTRKGNMWEPSKELLAKHPAITPTLDATAKE
ncbi:MAG: hypothetical protein IPM35_41330 [Myxococcales bacterium]|nr:hypothetical protein [Myxococcales bacterium]